LFYVHVIYRYHAFTSHSSRPPPNSTLFPYTTLFRSAHRRRPWQSAPTSSDRPPSGPTRSSRTPRRPRASPARSSRPSSTTCSTRSEEHTSELQSRENLVCRLLLEKKKASRQSNGNVI